jgi:hypothetical protein
MNPKKFSKVEFIFEGVLILKEIGLDLEDLQNLKYLEDCIRFQ